MASNAKAMGHGTETLWGARTGAGLAKHLAPLEQHKVARKDVGEHIQIS